MVSTPGADPPSSWFRGGRAELAVAAFVLLGFVALAWYVRPVIGVGTNDEMEYRWLSQSLGQGAYREIYTVGAPLAAKYPPVFPAMLLALRAIAGDRFEVIRAANLALFSAALLTLFLAGRRVVGVWAALAVLLLVGLNWQTLRYAGSMMSEPLYIALSVACLTLTRVTPTRGRHAVHGAMALALLAFLTRSVGITLIAAVGLWLLKRRAWRDAVLFAVASLIVVGGWFGYSRVASARQPVMGSYAEEFSRGTNASLGSSPGFAGRAKVFATRAGALGSTLRVPTIDGTMVDNIAWLAVIGVLLGVGLIILWGTWPAAAAYTAAYVVLMLLWPFPSIRLSLPLLPFLLLAMSAGAVRVARPLPVVWRIVGGLAMMLLLLFPAIRHASSLTAAATICDRQHPYTSRGCLSTDEQALAAMALTIRDRSTKGDVVLAYRKPASVAYLAERTIITPGALGALPAEVLVDSLRSRGVRYIMNTRFTVDESVAGDARHLLPACRQFQLEAAMPPVGYVVSLRPRGDTTGDACQALSSFAHASMPSTGR